MLVDCLRSSVTRVVYVLSPSIAMDGRNFNDLLMASPTGATGIPSSSPISRCATAI